MADPLTWSVVTLPLVTEGIKFLYGQATEALKRLQEKKKDPTAPTEVPTQNPLPEMFIEKADTPLIIHLDKVEALESELRMMHKDLAEYADDLTEPSQDDPHVLKRLDALRRLMEAVYDRPLTFQSEANPGSGPSVDSKLYVKEVDGDVTGLSVDTMHSGSATSDVKADSVSKGATLTATRVGKVG